MLSQQPLIVRSLLPDRLNSEKTHSQAPNLLQISIEKR